MKIQEFIDWLEEEKANGVINVCTNSFGECSIMTYGEGANNHITNRCRVEIPIGPASDMHVFIDATIQGYHINTNDGVYKVEVDLEPDTYPDWMEDIDKMECFSFVDLNDLLPMNRQ